MKKLPKNSRSRSRDKSRSNIFLYTICSSIVLFVTVFYFYTKEKSVNAYSNNQQSIVERTKDKAENDAQKKEIPDLNLQPNTFAPPSIVVEENSFLSTDLSSMQPATNQPTEETVINEETTESYADNLIHNLNNFYGHLDQQSYMQDFHLNRPSKAHFSILLQNLSNAPPVVTNETNDLFTLLKNTAHFFRILGKENIIVLKGILDREKPSFENIIKTFYALTDYPEAIEKEYGFTLTQDVLYDYAGFFLTTMGGRLYLFRRDSASRMTVSFYAILIIDKANKDGNNRHGIDLRPAIDFLINEMENTGKHLLLKEDYLDTLYDLKEHYN